MFIRAVLEIKKGSPNIPADNEIKCMLGVYFSGQPIWAVAETWRRVWGGRKKISWTKISVFTLKISDDLFCFIDQVFQILRFFTLLNVVYNPFFTRKTTISEKNSLIRPFFYSVRTFACIRQHYFSKYLGGPMHGPSPTSNFWGDRPSSAPLDLRPCIWGGANCNHSITHAQCYSGVLL